MRDREGNETNQMRNGEKNQKSQHDPHTFAPVIAYCMNNMTNLISYEPTLEKDTDNLFRQPSFDLVLLTFILPRIS